jgi:hypothetical protein
VAVALSVALLGVAWSRRASHSHPARLTVAAPPASRAPVTVSTSPKPTDPPPQLESSVTTLGRYGVVAPWVVTENRRAGTTAWTIPAGTPSSIEGFASTTYTTPGGVVSLYASTKTSTFHVEAYRMGYYGGNGARLVWKSADTSAAAQPTCTYTSHINMVSCTNWHVSMRVPVTSQFVPGDYLFKLVNSAGGQSYVPLTIWDPASHAAYLVKNDVYTWQAWNAYGGYDFYAGKGSCGGGYPICSRARVVSFDRPYAYGQGAGDFLGNDYPFVRFAEQHGLDVSYATDVAVEQHPALLLAHKALLSLGHDECWSLVERMAALAAQQHGVNMAFFAASPVLRHVRLESSPFGAARQEVDYRDSAEDPLNGHGNRLEVTGNTWSDAPASWSEVGFVGARYSGYLLGTDTADFRVADGSAWIFAGTGLHTGSVVPGLLRSDFDAFDSADHPRNEQIFGHSPIPRGKTQSNAPSHNGDVYSDMTYYTVPAGGAGVFDSGTNAWVPSLSPNPNVIPVVVMTGNLLRVFGQGPAAVSQASIPNWAQFYGDHS